jgi:Predicted transcriptional regulators
MNIGETIKRLRKQKDMTQEQLAQYLNISPQAISRWEMNSTLPDITLVPMLANIFNVTTDMLLGVDIDAKEKKIDATINEAYNYACRKQYDEADKLLRAALKEYPNSYDLMESFASILSLNLSCNGEKQNDEEKKLIREEIITLSEKILAECTDDKLRYLSIQRLCSIYAFMGENEKAASFAKKMPYTTQIDMITETLKGTKKYNHIQTQIAHGAFYNVLNSIASLININCVSLDDGSEPYKTDECIALNHKIIDIINILIEKGSFGDFNFLLVTAHQNLTFLYIQKRDFAAALNHFRLAAKHAVMYDSMPLVNDNSKDEYTSLLFKGVKFPFNMIHCSFTMTEHLLERSRELDSVLPASELEEIKNKLSNHTIID